MSAFSNWNGPGCGPCGPDNGGSLPQIQTLEQLLSEISNLKSEVTALDSELTAHIAEVPGDSAGPHSILNSRWTNLLTSINNVSALIGSGFSSSSTVANAITALQAEDARLNGKFGDLNNRTVRALYDEILQIIGSNFSTTNTVRGAITALQTSLWSNVETPPTASLLTLIRANETAITDLENALYNVGKTAIKIGLITEDDIQVGRIKVNTLLDFDKSTLIAPYIASVLNDAGNLFFQGRSVAIIGAMSIDYRAAAPNAQYKPKSARAFIKFVNSAPWDAIVDMSATYDAVGPSDVPYRGAISVLASKTSGRTTYTAGNNPAMPPLRFGLFKGTDTDGNIYILLGVALSELLNYDGAIGMRVHGINFIPISDITINGSIYLIDDCVADISENGELATNNFSTTGALKADEYETKDGSDIFKVDGDELVIGDVAKHTVIRSRSRPSIEDETLARHDIAYLTDLAQSIYWQKTVKYIFDDLAAGNNSVYYVDSEGKVVSPDAASKVLPGIPGVYTSNPYVTNPTARAFSDLADGDVALLRKSGHKINNIVDGRYNGVFTNSASDSYDLNKITGLIDKTLIVQASIGTGKGTMLQDIEGNIRKIGVVSGDSFTAFAVTAGDYFSYDLPAYAHWDSNLSSWVQDADIEVPETFDDIIADISYEWSGMAATAVPGQTVPYYHDTYATWTAHHQNNVTMQYSGIAWDYVEIVLDGYRNADTQDTIDDALLAITGMQADYAEPTSTIEVQLPEREHAVRVPNPAYIQHRPWVGVSVLDGGSFITPLMYAGWFVDGGDFTGLNGATLPIGDQPPVENQFKNVIIKIWRGAEIDEPATDNANFDWTLRWLTDKKVLHIMDLDGTNTRTLYEFMPIAKDQWDNRNIIHLPATEPTPVVNALAYDFATAPTFPINFSDYPALKGKSLIINVASNITSTKEVLIRFYQTGTMALGDILYGLPIQTFFVPATDATALYLCIDGGATDTDTKGTITIYAYDYE